MDNISLVYLAVIDSKKGFKILKQGGMEKGKELS